jgi:hypothetical protein
VYAARGVLSVHTERGTSIVPANRVAWIPAGFTHYHRAHSDGHDTTHVAHACGWANPSSFIAAITDIIGTTPGRHRNRHRRGTTPVT